MKRYHKRTFLVFVRCKYVDSWRVYSVCASKLGAVKVRVKLQKRFIRLSSRF